ncbi:hypothetical protein FALBO_3346 [Fusarium albosuccineum]|uniref:Uncharacterized protein n=1 Tax=Fusarium albosuccineum TaxID=1237068 RepID=A0A8H4LJZ5_9HYPO|nr:hypothetical protein FALBO_3346 [Fusarium albosuccineum]
MSLALPILSRHELDGQRPGQASKAGQGKAWHGMGHAVHGQRGGTTPLYAGASRQRVAGSWIMTGRQSTLAKAQRDVSGPGNLAWGKNRSMDGINWSIHGTCALSIAKRLRDKQFLKRPAALHAPCHGGSPTPPPSSAFQSVSSLASENSLFSIRDPANLPP